MQIIVWTPESGKGYYIPVVFLRHVAIESWKNNWSCPERIEFIKHVSDNFSKKNTFSLNNIFLLLIISVDFGEGIDRPRHLDRGFQRFKTSLRVCTFWPMTVGLALSNESEIEVCVNNQATRFKQKMSWIFFCQYARKNLSVTNSDSLQTGTTRLCTCFMRGDSLHWINCTPMLWVNWQIRIHGNKFVPIRLVIVLLQTGISCSVLLFTQCNAQCESQLPACVFFVSLTGKRGETSLLGLLKAWRQTWWLKNQKIENVFFSLPQIDDLIRFWSGPNFCSGPRVGPTLVLNITLACSTHGQTTLQRVFVWGLHIGAGVNLFVGGGAHLSWGHPLVSIPGFWIRFQVFLSAHRS